jgi:hypothetical protein
VREHRQELVLAAVQVRQLRRMLLRPPFRFAQGRFGAFALGHVFEQRDKIINRAVRVS